MTEARVRTPVVRLRNGRYVPKFPSQPHTRGRAYGWIREVLEGSLFLPTYQLIDPAAPETRWIMQDFEDNLYISREYSYDIPNFDEFWFSRGGFSMRLPSTGLQPNLWRDGSSTTSAVLNRSRRASSRGPHANEHAARGATGAAITSSLRRGPIHDCCGDFFLDRG